MARLVFLKILTHHGGNTRGTRTEGGLATAVPSPEPGSRGEVAALGVLGPEIRCSSKRKQDRWLKSLLLAAEQINEDADSVSRRP